MPVLVGLGRERDHQILRFQVAVNDAVVVGVLEGRANLEGDVQDLLPAEPAALGEDFLEVLAGTYSIA